MFDEEKTNFPQGIPNPNKLACGIDYFLSDYYTDQSKSIAAICKLLDRPVCYTDENGYEHEVVGGTASEDNRRIAWIECSSKMLSQSHVDVEFRLKATVDGEPTIDWKVETYNPYFGCHVRYMQWWGDNVVVIYQEKHDTILCSVKPCSEVRLIPINYRWQMVNDVVLYLGEEPELIEVQSIPDITRQLPLPLSWVESEKITLPSREQLRYPQDRGKLWDGLRKRLFGNQAPQPAADLIIGSLGYPFWDDFPQPTSVYPYGRNVRWNSPRCLPFYWHEILPADEQETFTELLKEVIQQETCVPSPSWSQEDCGIESSATYIKNSLAFILKECTSECPPNRLYCYFWSEWSQEEFQKTLDLFPPGFRDVYPIIAREQHRWSDDPD